MDQEIKHLIKQAKKEVNQIKTAKHLVWQVRTHIDRLCATGEGKEVLEHFLKFRRKYRHGKKTINKVYYFEGVICDANNIKSEFYTYNKKDKKWNLMKWCNKKSKYSD